MLTAPLSAGEGCAGKLVSVTPCCCPTVVRGDTTITSTVAAGQTTTDKIKLDHQDINLTRLYILQDFLLVGTVHERSGVISETLGLKKNAWLGR